VNAAPPPIDQTLRASASNRRELTLGELAALPATVDLVTAGRALGIGRTTAHKLARDGQFPCPVLRPARIYRVPTAGLLKLLGIELTPPTQPAYNPRPANTAARKGARARAAGQTSEAGSGFPENEPQREHDMQNRTNPHTEVA
jgi:hypothetical protein